MTVNPRSSLVPPADAITGSYWCTWQTQVYTVPGEILRAVDHKELGAKFPALARNNLTEAQLFGAGGWTAQIPPEVRRDLLLVLDDGLDVAVRDSRESWEYGSLELSEEKFPSCRGEPTQRLAKMVELAQRHGWAGVGLWCACQCAGDNRVPGQLLDEAATRHYWQQRARWCASTGGRYWKVDWGARQDHLDFRQLLSKVAGEQGGGLLVEHACTMPPFNDWENSGRIGSTHYAQFLRRLLAFSDVVRCYDVIEHFGVVSLLDRVATLLLAPEAADSAAVLNTEDELYLGAALGCTLGVMRLSTWEQTPGLDRWFPTRSYLNMDEVVRAVRWQRIAPPVALRAVKNLADGRVLWDSWFFEAGDTFPWLPKVVGREVHQGAPARIARGMALPEVSAHGDPPFVVASRHPNGAVAVAALRRTLGRGRIETPRADVTIDGPAPDRPIGVFGRYQSLCVRVPAQPRRVLVQDLAGEQPEDITAAVRADGGRVLIPGEIIDRISQAAARPNDASEPGLIIVFQSAC